MHLKSAFVLPAFFTLVIFAGVLVYFSTPKYSVRSALPGKTTSEGTVTLTLSPSTIKTTIAKEDVLDVLVDTGPDKLTAAELHFKYDPKAVKVRDFTAGNFLAGANVLNKNIDNAKGEAVLVVGTLDPKNGNGKLATISFTGIKKGTITVGLGNGSRVAVGGKSQDALKSTVDAKVEIH